MQVSPCSATFLFLKSFAAATNHRTITEFATVATERYRLMLSEGHFGKNQSVLGFPFYGNGWLLSKKFPPFSLTTYIFVRPTSCSMCGISEP